MVDPQLPGEQRNIAPAPATPLAPPPLQRPTFYIQMTKPVVSRVSLFGSLVAGQERDDSDIDLFIVVKTDKDKENIEPAIGELSAVCLDLFGNRLAPYILSQREWKAKKLLAVVKAAEKGMVLYESKV